jgi:hypothetical protein
MTTLFSRESFHILFIVIPNLLPLLSWIVWDLVQRGRSWLTRRQARNTPQQKSQEK